MSRNIFFTTLNISVGAYPNAAQIEFPFQTTRIIIVNDGDVDDLGDLEFSFLKPHVDGIIKHTDGPIVFDQINQGKLWLRRLNTTNAIGVRVWAWRGSN